MLVIRDAQMRAFRSERQRVFEDVAVGYVARQTGKAEAFVRAEVRDGIREAVAAGLQREAQILRWLTAASSVHDDAEKQERVRSILQDSELTPSLKLTLIEDDLRP
jgi:hypothetical protein